MGRGLDTYKAKVFFGVALAFLILCSIAIVARVCARRFKRLPFATDDWLCFASFVFFAAEIGVQYYAVFAGGVGLPITQVSEAELVNLLKHFIILQLVFAIALFLVRASICFFNMRIFPQTWFQRSMWMILISNLGVCLFIIIDAFVNCVPFKYNWDKSIPGGHCGHTSTSYLVNASWGVVNDIAIWSLPQFIVWRLQMSFKRKLAVSGVFALGLVDISAAIARAVEISRLSERNITEMIVAAEIWTYTEVGIAIMVACLPPCGVFFRKQRQQRTPRSSQSFKLSARSSKFSRPFGKSSASGTQDDDEFQLRLADRTKDGVQIGYSQRTSRATSIQQDHNDSAITELPSDSGGDIEDGIRVRRDFLVSVEVNDAHAS